MSDLDLDDSGVEPNDTDHDNDSSSGNEGGNEPVTMEDTIRNRYKELMNPGEDPSGGEQKATDKQQKDGTTPKIADASQTPQEYPTSWRKNGSIENKWATLDPEVRGEILKRETDMRAGIEQYKDKAGYAERIYNLFQPYQAILQKEGMGHDKFVQQMLNTSYKLYAGTPEEKVMTVIQMCQQNGINLEGLVQSVSNMAAGKNAVDPNLLALQQQLAQVQNQHQQFTQQQVNQQMQQYNNTVTAFANEPTSKYINEPGVKDLMATLIESGQAKSLQDAYDKAIGAIPEVRTKLFAEQQDALNKTAAEKAAKAKNASSTNLSTRGKHTPKTSQKVGTMEDTIRNTYRAIQERGE